MGYISHDKMLNEFIRKRRQEILSPYIIGAKLSHRKKSWRIAHNFTLSLSLSPPQKEKKKKMCCIFSGTTETFFSVGKHVISWPKFCPGRPGPL